MCGIAGYVSVKQFDERFRVAFPIMGLFMQNRGSDAWGWTDGEKIVKRVGSLSGGISYGLYGRLAAALHTRHATHGSKDDKANAHPFKVGSIIGMHNGIVYNHDEMNKEYNRKFEVDSMHIFAHLDEGKDLSELRGYGAVCFVHNGQWHLGRFNSGELSLAHIPNVGWAWASTRSALETALGMSGFEAGIIWLRLKEGRCYVIDGHNIKKSPNFKLNIGERPWNSRDWNSYGSGVTSYGYVGCGGGTSYGTSPSNNNPNSYYGGKGQNYGKQLKASTSETSTTKEDHTSGNQMTLEEVAVRKVTQALNTSAETKGAKDLETFKTCSACGGQLKEGGLMYLNSLDDSICESCASGEADTIGELRGPYMIDKDIKTVWVSEVNEKGDIFCENCGDGFFDSEKAYDVNPNGKHPYILCITCLEEEYLDEPKEEDEAITAVVDDDDGITEFVPKTTEEALDDATAEVSKPN